MLRQAIRDGKVGAYWTNGLPKKAWAVFEGRPYEASLSNEGQGWYHAYELTEPEVPEGI